VAAARATQVVLTRRGRHLPPFAKIFAGDLGQAGVKFNTLTPDQRATAAIAAGFTGLLSLFNIAGRFCWASFSDYIGRRNTYYILAARHCALCIGTDRRLHHPVDVRRWLRDGTRLFGRYVRHAVSQVQFTDGC
jgi:hypothetical protein